MTRSPRRADAMGNDSWVAFKRHPRARPTPAVNTRTCQEPIRAPSGVLTALIARRPVPSTPAHLPPPTIDDPVRDLMRVRLRTAASRSNAISVAQLKAASAYPPRRPIV
jgi:hypothetical protein